ncbi:MAG: TROVE domain-containing protein [Bryobacteraceae bacterium]
MLDLQQHTTPIAHGPRQSVDIWMRLTRFLMLGSEDGTYYVRPRALTLENATAVVACLKTDGLRVVRTLVEISTAGRAPKNAPALFELALAASPNFADAETVRAALSALPQVARTGSDLCIFAAFVENLRGWGRALRSAVADWYLSKPASELAYQMLTHPHGNGWSHRDLLRLAHPKAATPAHNALFQWAVDGELGHLASPEILSGDLRQIRAFEQAKKSSNENEIILLIEENRLNHELVPSEWKTSARVWEALLPSMPNVDLVRHLGKLTEVGLIQPQSPATALVVARLIDRKRIANSRIHPIALLDVQQAYKQLPRAVTSVIDALDEAFHLAFENVEPIGKRVHLVRDSSSAYATVTDALAMLFEKKTSNSVDAFVIITDNKPPTEALERKGAKLVVIALAATDCSISDPDDAGQLGIAGFDATVPQVVAEFIDGWRLG